MAAVSTPELKKLDRRRVSCETLCSSNSSCVLQKRKPLHPLATGVRSRNNNPVTQRVLSAKLLRFKTLQNQLNDANYHIAQLVTENKLLKNLQKRQDQALSKYEGANAQLPQVLESHQEEIRIQQSKNKTLRKSVKELTDQLKLKDEELNTLRDQNKHLLMLCKNKNLEEREKLHEKLEEMNDRLRQSESTISMLNRKLMLESKNYKFKLNSEINKHKLTQQKLNRALTQLGEIEGKEKSPQSSGRRMRSTERRSDSALLLTDTKVSLKNNSTAPAKSPAATSSSCTNLSEDVSCSSSKSSSEQGTSSSEAQIKEIVNSWQKKSTSSSRPDTGDPQDSHSHQKVSFAEGASESAANHKLHSQKASSAKYSNEKHPRGLQKAVGEPQSLMESFKCAEGLQMLGKDPPGLMDPQEKEELRKYFSSMRNSDKNSEGFQGSGKELQALMDSQEEELLKYNSQYLSSGKNFSKQSEDFLRAGKEPQTLMDSQEEEFQKYNSQYLSSRKNSSKHSESFQRPKKDRNSPGNSSNDILSEEFERDKEEEEELNKYTTQLISFAKQSNEAVDHHTEDFRKSMQETELLLDNLKEVDDKNEELKHQNFYDYPLLAQKNANKELISQFLSSESKYSFEEDLLSEKASKALKITEPEVDREDRKKLLATLKAIDNGDNVVISDMKKSKCDLMKELFG